MGLAYYGPKGDKGFPGMKGEPGRIVEQVWPNRTTTIIGPKGEHGSVGNAGDPGLQGYPGTKGEKGFSGRDGIAGAKGEKGLPGQPGSRVIHIIQLSRPSPKVKAESTWADPILVGTDLSSKTPTPDFVYRGHLDGENDI